MKQHIRSFSNDFRWIPELHNKNTLDIAWNIQYDRRPQGLLIRGDLTERFLGNQHLNQGIRQTVDVPRFHSHATLSYNPGTYGQIKHFYGLGVLNKRIRLRSDRSLISSSGDFHPDVNINPNNMDWKSDKVYLKGSYHYKQPSWEVDISLPLAWQRTRYADSALFSEKEDAGLLFEPHLRIKWELAAGNRLEFQYSRQNDFGSFTSVYQGPLLSIIEAFERVTWSYSIPVTKART